MGEQTTLHVVRNVGFHSNETVLGKKWFLCPFLTISVILEEIFRVIFLTISVILDVFFSQKLKKSYQHQFDE